MSSLLHSLSCGRTFDNHLACAGVLLLAACNQVAKQAMDVTTLSLEGMLILFAAIVVILTFCFFVRVFDSALHLSALLPALK